MPCNRAEHLKLDRRVFLSAGGIGFCGMHVPNFLDAAQSTVPRRKVAKSTILIWLDGGPSHIDTWDMKPSSPSEYRGEFKPISTSTPGIKVCEHLPHLARQTHHLALVQSLGQDVSQSPNNHASGIYNNLTAHSPDPTFSQLGESRMARPDDWPFIGSVVAHKRPLHPYLPQLVSLPRRLRVISDTPGQYAGRLGKQFDPLYVNATNNYPTNFIVPALNLTQDVTMSRLQDRRQLLASLDDSQRKFENSLFAGQYNKHQERAFSLLLSTETKEAFNIAAEPESVRNRYGEGVNALSMLLARRLVEAGVPFVTLIWKKEDAQLHKKKYCNGVGSWDTHGKTSFASRTYFFRTLTNRLLRYWMTCIYTAYSTRHW